MVALTTPFSPRVSLTLSMAPCSTPPVTVLRISSASATTPPARGRAIAVLDSGSVTWLRVDSV